jgi:hypothetical protein
MRASCSSIVVDDFDDFNDKSLYSSSNNSISLINDIQNNDFPFFDDYSQEIIKKKDLQSNNEMCPSSCPKSIPYDPQLASLIENELGLNDCQTSRKNAWGNLSYAELIAKAIQNSSQQRLTLSQIYSWMISYIPYFRDKADKKSSTGWKVRYQSFYFHLNSNILFRILFVIIYHYIIVLLEFQMKLQENQVGGLLIQEQNKLEEEKKIYQMKIQLK